MVDPSTEPGAVPAVRLVQEIFFLRRSLIVLVYLNPFLLHKYRQDDRYGMFDTSMF